MACRYCGSEKGYWSHVVGTQYYDADGNPEGYVLNTKSKTLHCINCGKTTTLEKIEKKKAKNQNEN